MNGLLNYRRFPTSILVGEATRDPTAQFLSNRTYGNLTARIPGMTKPSMSPEGLRIRYDGKIEAAGLLLGPAPVSYDAAIQSPNAAQEERGDPQPTYDSSNYGEEDDITITFAAAGDLLVLPRPNQTRISLTIQNQTVAGGIRYSFNKPANAGTIIIAGGNRIWDDKVPQGDLHITAIGGGGVVVVSFMNRNIRQ